MAKSNTTPRQRPAPCRPAPSGMYPGAGAAHTLRVVAGGGHRPPPAPPPADGPPPRQRRRGEQRRPQPRVAGSAQPLRRGGGGRRRPTPSQKTAPGIPERARGKMYTFHSLSISESLQKKFEAKAAWDKGRPRRGAEFSKSFCSEMMFLKLLVVNIQSSLATIIVGHLWTPKHSFIKDLGDPAGHNHPQQFWR